MSIPTNAFAETLSATSSTRNSPSLSPKRPLSKTLHYLNPFRVENFTSHIAIKSPARAKLYKSRWYGKLLIVQYCLSVALIGDLLYVFPGGGATVVLSHRWTFLLFIIYYLLYISFGIMILFLSTLLFLDKNLRRMVPFSLKRNSFASFVVWFMCIFVLVGVCLYWEYGLLSNDYGPFRWSIWTSLLILLFPKMTETGLFAGRCG